MTTIAYNHKDKEIAYDSRSTRGYLIHNDNADKKIVSDDGSIYFLAGKSGDTEDFADEFCVGRVSSRTLDCQGIAVKDGVAFGVGTKDNGEFVAYELDCNATYGSGVDFAIAAMDFGKSAKEAVEYVKTRDIYTGGKVRTFKL
jgi:ATP-dependent protease HslVU (ClpYQ) peptidase subunit